jgi:hypothetical protein
MSKNNETINKIPEWVRWPLVPITSMLTVAVVWVLVALVAKIFVFLGGDRGPGENFFTYLIVPGIASYCAVSSAAYMAPKFKQLTMIIMSSLWIFLAGILTFFSILSLEWHALIQIASFSIGSVTALLDS